MPDYTLANFRGMLSSSCFPAGAVDSQKTGLINKGRELIYNSEEGGGWVGTVVTVCLSIVTDANGCQFITLPMDCGTLVGLYDSWGSVGIRNTWFRYLRQPAQNPQYWYQGGDRQVDDLGDGFVTFVDLPSAGINPKFSIPFSQTNDIVIVIAGLTDTGARVSERLTISGGGTSVTSINVYTRLDQILFNVQEQNDATLTDSVSGDVYGIYSPGTAVVNFRRYAVPKTTQTSVAAVCKRKYVLLMGDNDYVDLGNLVGMELAIRAYQYSQRGDTDHMNATLGQAITLFNGEAARYMSETELGTVRVDYVTSPGTIQNIM